MVDVKINDNVYEGVSEVHIPLNDGSGNASFLDTSTATAEAENIDKGFTAFANGKKLVGTRGGEENPFLLRKLGSYEWVSYDAEGTTNPLVNTAILGCVADIKEYCANKIIEAGIQVNNIAYLTILAVADEAPASTNGPKALIIPVAYKPSDSTLSVVTPKAGFFGSFYGGVNAMTIKTFTGAVEDDGTDDNLVIDNTGGLKNNPFECATCTLYGIDINFP